MKYGWVVLLVLVGWMSPRAAKAQASVYAEFTASDLQGGPKGDYLYGGQAGVLIDGPTIFKHVLLQADIQGRFVTENSESLTGVVVGPRFSVAPRKKYFFKLSPYAEFNVGFARYNDGSNNSSTDGLFSTEGGVTRPVTSHLDAVLDYSYAFYGYNFGYYQPQSYSGGVVYHFAKR
jgi:hypothetical protein